MNDSTVITLIGTSTQSTCNWQVGEIIHVNGKARLASNGCSLGKKRNAHR
ncbi:MAG: hypothetical protein JKY29_02275 [Gammaproteobacteria bacterium]|nr:hypothetical protein [Gammaproteobacteria bacterium]